MKKQYSHRIKKLWIAFWIACAGVLGKFAGEQILERFSRIREMTFFLAPPDKVVLPISLCLYSVSILCLGFSLGIFLVRAIRVAGIRRRAMSVVDLTVADVAYMERLHRKQNA